MREIVLDTETTGLKPAEGHRIIEIGCVELINLMPTGQVFHAYVNPERDVPFEAQQVSGIRTEFLLDKPKFHEVCQGFLDFIQDSPLVIHNAAFDMGFLNAELERLFLPQLPLDRAIDTVRMARAKFPGSPANLDALCRRFKIDLSERTKHGALLDAQLLAKVYLELKGGRQKSLHFHDQEVAQSVTQASFVAKSPKATRPIRPHEPTDAEKHAHQELLASIKNSLWGV